MPQVLRNGVDSGSSPRMRGARSCPNPRMGMIRIIPADAGSTHRLPVHHPSWPDHPRGCGEHRRVGINYPAFEGSSPRMRGALWTIRTQYPTRGIIPADAGSTMAHDFPTDQRPDHPRGCGEHIWWPSTDRPCSGSSPRMRGARTVVEQGQKVFGIIPADAGSTSLSV